MLQDHKKWQFRPQSTDHKKSRRGWTKAKTWPVPVRNKVGWYRSWWIYNNMGINRYFQQPCAKLWQNSSSVGYFFRWTNQSNQTMLHHRRTLLSTIDICNPRVCNVARYDGVGSKNNVRLVRRRARFSIGSNEWRRHHWTSEMGVGGHDTIAFGRSSGISDERTAMSIVVERQGWFGENDVDCHGHVQQLCRVPQEWHSTPVIVCDW